MSNFYYCGQWNSRHPWASFLMYWGFYLFGRDFRELSCWAKENAFIFNSCGQVIFLKNFYLVVHETTLFFFSNNSVECCFEVLSVWWVKRGGSLVIVICICWLPVSFSFLFLKFVGYLTLLFCVEVLHIVCPVSCWIICPLISLWELFVYDSN